MISELKKLLKAAMACSLMFVAGQSAFAGPEEVAAAKARIVILNPAIDSVDFVDEQITLAQQGGEVPGLCEALFAEDGSELAQKVLAGFVAEIKHRADGIDRALALKKIGSVEIFSCVGFEVSADGSHNFESGIVFLLNQAVTKGLAPESPVMARLFRMAKFVKSTLFHYAKRDFGALLDSRSVLNEGDYLAAVGQAFAEFMADYQAALVVAEDGGASEGELDDENPFVRVASVFYPAGVDDDSDDADGLPAPRSAGRTTPRSRSGSQLSRLSSVDSETLRAFTDVDIGFPL